MRNQRILLVSPQPWDHIPLSKHHYAVELAERGNTVFFLDPPRRSRSEAVAVESIPGNPRMFRVAWSSAIPLAIRYHARPLHDVLMRRKQRRIGAAIGGAIDVVWSFEFNLFTDLKGFGGKLAIFHPVDPLSASHQFAVAKSADFVFCVSETICAGFRGMNVPSRFINHGLSAPFAELARNPQHATRSANDPVRVGYSGNLLRPEINWKVLMHMIDGNPSVEFHFWGPYKAQEVPDRAREVMTYLTAQRNVVLHGRVSPEELARAMARMDCFVLAYDFDQRTFDRSNSHKLLEYLSTGMTVVSSRIASYTAHGDLIRMPDDGNDDALPSLLTDTLNKLKVFNSRELSHRRRALALDNTYASQLDRIEAFLAAKLKPNC